MMTDKQTAALYRRLFRLWSKSMPSFQRMTDGMIRANSHCRGFVSSCEQRMSDATLGQSNYSNTVVAAQNEADRIADLIKSLVSIHRDICPGSFPGIDTRRSYDD